MNTRVVRYLSIVYVALAASGNTALASDGEIEINQAIALAGGVNGDSSADPAGFPVRITQAGSYRLTGNLTVPLNQTAILIDANLVTLDLGGFTISGGNSCSGYPTTSCTATGPNAGIIGNGYLTVVRNGAVVEMGGTCIALNGGSSEIHHVRVLTCGGWGISIGAVGRVTNSFVGSTLSAGIVLGDGAIAESNEVRATGYRGIVAPGGRLNASVIGNRVFDNRDLGIASHFNTLVSRNVATANAGTTQISGGVSRGDNFCNGVNC